MRVSITRKAISNRLYDQRFRNLYKTYDRKPYFRGNKNVYQSSPKARENQMASKNAHKKLKLYEITKTKNKPSKHCINRQMKYLTSKR